MSKEIEKAMRSKLEQRKQKSTFRSLVVEDHLMDFSSNDYLGFASKQLLNLDTGLNIQSGAKASRLISGNSALHETVEQEIANYHHATCGLLFNSGYDANVGLVGCIGQRGDTIIYDELSHASIRDGLKMSLANAIPFRHNDLNDLELQLKRSNGNIFVVTEGLFSMDGDYAPLVEILELCKPYNAAIIVDEAHSNGIIGEQGKGWVCQLGLEKEIFARIHTFGKAMGCHGAIVLGSRTLRDYLINYARSFIFTTAIPPHSVHLIRKSYQVLAETTLIGHLNQLISTFRAHLHPEKSAQFLPSISPIQSWVLGNADKARFVAREMQGLGFGVKPIVSPTVPLGKERIRISINASHPLENIRQLATCINELNI